MNRYTKAQMKVDLIIHQLTPSKPLREVSELSHCHSKKESISVPNKAQPENLEGFEGFMLIISNAFP